MDFEEWKYKINSLNFSLKSYIVDIFKDFHHPTSLSFIPITDSNLISSFNNINNYKPITLCLDIEFQSAITNSNKYILTQTIKKDNVAKFIRELGMLFFIKDQELNIYYIGHLFLNFESLTKLGFDLKSIKLIGSKYATTVEDVYNKMNHLEDNFKLKPDNKLRNNYLFQTLLPKHKRQTILDKLSDPEQLNYVNRQLTQIQHEIYGKYLKDKDYDIFTELNNLYWGDSLVKDRLVLMENKYDVFIELLTHIIDNSVLVIKGKLDIIAIKNSFMLISKQMIDINYYYDIETFNGFSNTHYKSSQLENTYKGLIETDVYKDIAKPLFDEIIVNIGNKAHNPVVDSLFTIVVAVVMNLGLNNYFVKKGGYNREYKKYKTRYLQLKK